MDIGWLWEVQVALNSCTIPKENYSLGYLVQGRNQPVLERLPEVLELHLSISINESHPLYYYPPSQVATHSSPSSLRKKDVEGEKKNHFDTNASYKIAIYQASR